MMVEAFSQKHPRYYKGLDAWIKNTDGTNTHAYLNTKWDIGTNYSFKFVLLNTKLTIYYNDMNTPAAVFQT